jgi:Protein of unknown function (DUF3107)
MSPGSERSSDVDVRIGIIQTAKELEIELSEGADRDEVLKQVEAALAAPDGVLWLTDKHGRQIAVPAKKVAYVELGAASEGRRVGFGGR